MLSRNNRTLSAHLVQERKAEDGVAAGGGINAGGSLPIRLLFYSCRRGGTHCEARRVEGCHSRLGRDIVTP
jgi:hypothetical protein